jgi:hypothetical protein
MRKQGLKDASSNGCRIAEKAAFMRVFITSVTVLILFGPVLGQTRPNNPLPPLDDGRGSPARPNVAPAKATSKPATVSLSGKSRPKPVNKKAVKPSPVVPSPVVKAEPVRALRPSEMPTVAPRVSFDNGKLTIVAANSSMADIIAGIRSATGIRIETIGGPSGDRVAARIGPAPVRSVLLSLLQGSRYDYVMLGSVNDPDVVERVILSPRAIGAEPTAAATPMRPSAAAEPEVEEESTVDEESGNEGLAPVPAPAPVPTMPEGQPQPGTDPNEQQQLQQQLQQQRGEPNTTPKTPEQLLEDLKRLEQERQQQQNQSNEPRREERPR